MIRFLIFSSYLLSLSATSNEVNCNSDNLSFYEDRICEAKKAQSLEKELNKSLQEIKTLIPMAYQIKPDNGEASSSELLLLLEKSQKEWLEMVAKDCELSFNFARGGNGTGAPFAANNCYNLHYKNRLAQFNSRIKQLKSIVF